MSNDRVGALGRSLPYLGLLLSLGCFQYGAALAKPLFAVIGAQGASALRLGLAAIMLAALVRPWRVPLGVRVRWLVLGYGLGLAGLNLFFFMAIRTVPLGLTVALEFVGPLALAIAGSRRAVDLVWAALAAFGIVLIVPITGLGAGLDPVGVGFALLSACCWVAYIVFGKKAGAAIPGEIAAALGLVVAALAVLPFGIAFAGTDLLRLDILPLGLAVAIVSGSLPYVLEMAALRRMSTRVFGILMSLEPAFGALFGYVVLGQHLTALQSLAITAIIAASAGVTLTREPLPVPQ